jgi:hypothetical protein
MELVVSRSKAKIGMGNVARRFGVMLGRKVILVRWDPKWYRLDLVFDDGTHLIVRNPAAIEIWGRKSQKLIATLKPKRLSASPLKKGAVL